MECAEFTHACRQAMSDTIHQPIVVTHDGGVRFAAQIRSHRVVVDQPERAGGDDSGPMPLELLGAETPKGLYVEVMMRPAPPDAEPPLESALSLLAELHAPTSKGPANRIQSQARILPADDFAPAMIVHDALKRDGMAFRLACRDLRFERSDGSNQLRGVVSDAGFTDEFDRVLISSGRVPNTRDLNLEAVHVDYDEQGVMVNDRLQTICSHIYAAGDVCSPYKFTHAAVAQARTVIANALFLPTSDKKLVDSVLKTMMAAPAPIAAAAMKGILAFGGPGMAKRCTVPALHLAATPSLNPPHLMSQWMPKVVNGWTVGAGHFNMMEAPDQVNSMIEGFLRHHV